MLCSLSRFGSTINPSPFSFYKFSATAVFLKRAQHATGQCGLNALLLTDVHWFEWFDNQLRISPSPLGPVLPLPAQSSNRLRTGKHIRTCCAEYLHDKHPTLPFTWTAGDPYQTPSNAAAAPYFGFGATHRPHKPLLNFNTIMRGKFCAQNPFTRREYHWLRASVFCICFVVSPCRFVVSATCYNLYHINSRIISSKNACFLVFTVYIWNISVIVTETLCVVPSSSLA